MTDFTYMHIFFAVSTAAVILITAFLCAALVSLFRLFRTLQKLAQEVEEEAENLRTDLHELREDIKDGFRLVPFVSFFGKAAKRITRKAAPKKRIRKSS